MSLELQISNLESRIEKLENALTHLVTTAALEQVEENLSTKIARSSLLEIPCYECAGEKYSRDCDMCNGLHTVKTQLYYDVRDAIQDYIGRL